MAGAKAVLTLDGDVAKLIQKQDKVIQKLKEQNRLLKKTGRESKKAGADGSAMGDKFTSSLGRMAAGFLSVTAAAAGVRKIIGDIEELNRSAEQATRSIDEMQRRVFVQANLKKSEWKPYREAIIGGAMEAAVPLSTSFFATRELLSQGFPPEEVREGTLLKTILATGKMLPEGQIDIQALAGVLKGLHGKKGITKANAEDVLRRIFGVFREYAIQFKDIVDIAKFAGTAEGAAVPFEEQVSAFTVLKPIHQAETSAMAMRNIILRFQSAADFPARRRALKDLGVKPSEVDLYGETFQEAVELIRDRSAGLTPPERAGALDRLLGKRGGPQLKDLMKNMDEYRQIRKEQQIGMVDYTNSLSILTSGPAAEAQRADLAMQAANFAPVRSLRYSARRQMYALHRKAAQQGAISVVGQGLANTVSWLRSVMGEEPSGFAETLRSGVTVGFRYKIPKQVEKTIRGLERIQGEIDKDRIQGKIDEVRQLRKALEDLGGKLDKNGDKLDHNSGVTEDNTRKVVSDPNRGELGM